MQEQRFHDQDAAASGRGEALCDIAAPAANEEQ
jgi:hypothetical protein